MKTLQDFAGETLLFLKGSLLFLIGPLDAQLMYVGVALLIDLVFGVKVAKKEKTFSWKVFTTKVSNKVLIYVAWIAMFNAMDMVVGLPNTARTSVIVVLMSMEILSASKNTAKLGYGRLAELLENIYFVLSKENPVAPKKEDESEDVKEGSDKK